MNIEQAVTATPRPRSESPFTLLGIWRGVDRMAIGQQVWPAYLGRQRADLRINPSFTRNHAVVAAKPGSLPRGAKR